MGATAAIVVEWFATIGAAEAGAAVVGTEVAAGAGAATAAGAGAGAAGAGAATVAGAGAAGAATSGGFWGALGQAAAGAAAGAAVSSLLAPKAPRIPGVTPMPDPLAQEEARRRSITEQLARRGRSSTIMTQPSGGKLGG